MARKKSKLKPKDIPDGPFTTARIVRIIKENAPEHMVSWRVKKSGSLVTDGAIFGCCAR